MNFYKLAAAAIVMTIAAAAPAHAYSYRTCGDINLRFSSNSATLRSSDVSFPAGYWQNGLIDAVTEVNKNPSNFFYTRVSDTNGVGLSNGENEVWGSTDQGILQGAPAIAYSNWDCYWLFGWYGNMTEGDVIFDYNFTTTQWTASNAKSANLSYGGTGRSLQATAIHEFGHAAGLLHENRTYNVMGADYNHLHTNGEITKAYIGEDTGNALVFLYGLWAGGPNDLGVAHWRHTGASGEYSLHGRTRVFDAATGAELPWSWVAGEPVYWVTRGTNVNVEFTFENLGRDTLNGINVKWYISRDGTIVTADRVLATSTYTLSRDWVLTSQRTVRLPPRLVHGRTYWLGTVVNADGAIAESDSSNNATYVGIRVN